MSSIQKYRQGKLATVLNKRVHKNSQESRPIRHRTAPIYSPPKPPRRLNFLQHFSRGQKARLRHTVPRSGSASDLPCLASADPSNKSSLTAATPLSLKSTLSNNIAEDNALGGIDGLPDTIPEMTSGSGKDGPPSLAVRTLARELKRLEKVGAGSYGEVWTALFRGDVVAMKIFHPVREQAFERERDIYETNLLRHENILGKLWGSRFFSNSLHQILRRNMNMNVLTQSSVINNLADPVMVI